MIECSIVERYETNQFLGKGRHISGMTGSIHCRKQNENDDTHECENML
jgi:hypothetical protein